MMGEKRPPVEREPVPPYTALAAGYDFVMAHVDYRLWAEYVQSLIDGYVPEARSVLELGCGTGSLAVLLQPERGYHYVASDRSEEMLDVARRKARAARTNIHFRKADFADFNTDEQFDVAVLLFDGLNYLLEKEEVRHLLACTYDALAAGGIFIVDQSTPANSLNNGPYFESSDRRDDFAYMRTSRFDLRSGLHRTMLELSVGDRRYVEEHVQRAYTIEEIRALIDVVGFEVEASYDGFSFEDATHRSERVHWILRRPS